MDIKAAVREALVENEYSPDGLDELVEEKLTTTNKPSAKCYSIECPAIWHDKCTSSKYHQCLDNQVE